MAIAYFGSQEDNDADETIALIKAIGGNAVKYRADLRCEAEAVRWGVPHSPMN